MRTFYINGEPADIDDKTTINLSYKSPIFSDLQKLIANTTLTIKLPRTAHNHKLINNIGSIGVQSKFGYDYFRADYVVDGLSMIENGVGYILSISDSIEVSVIFGGMSGLSKIKDTKLNEIPIPLSECLVNWGENWAEIGSTKGIFFPYADFGVNVYDQHKITEHVHPSVRVTQIIDWINQAYGVSVAPIGQDMAVPCVSKKRYNAATPAVFKSVIAILNGEHWVRLDTPIGYESWNYIVALVPIQSNEKRDQLFCMGTGSYRLEAKIGETRSISKFGIRSSINNSWEWWEKKEGSQEHCDIELKKGASYSFIAGVAEDFAPTSTVIFSIVPIDENILQCEKFDALHNLPPIKVMDFLKAIMQINGVFPMLKEVGSIGYLSVDDLYAKIGEAKDWSDKLIEVKSKGFRFADFAQENILLWTEDETAPRTTIGTLTVENKTVEASREAIKLPFASLENDAQGVAMIPLYYNSAKKGEPLEIDTNNLKPRILKFGGRSTGMLTARAINDAEIMALYEQYQKTINTPKIVKCLMKLSARDLSELDLTVPVYVEQLSGHYAVMEVTTRGDVADVEMLML